MTDITGKILDTDLIGTLWGDGTIRFISPRIIPKIQPQIE